MFTKNGNALSFTHNGEVLHIAAWGENSLRVRAAIFRPVQDDDWALLPPAPCEANIEIGDGEASIQNGNITAKLTVNPYRKQCRVAFYNASGDLLLQEIGDGGALALKARHFRGLAGGSQQLTVRFDANAGEKLYGMGQYQQDILNINHCNFELAHRNSQASIPFVLSNRGYGLLWHNPAIGRASFGKNQMEWMAESTDQMDYWITAGESPSDIMRAYMTATGKPPMMPEYGLGFWQSRLRYWSQEQLLGVAREYKRRDLPIDVIVCDFFHWPKMGDFRFEEEFFPDPEGMTRELKEMGIELMVSVWPQIALESENFAEMLEKGYLVRTERGVNIDMQFGGDSVFFDATNAEARQYVWEKCKKNYYDKGIQIFWLDEAEPEYGTYDFDNYRYKLGPNVKIGNIYPQKYSQGFYEGMQASGQADIVNLVRCAWAGSQRYGALVWSGDIQCTFESFRAQICAGLNMAIAGIPWWTTDIGGFHGGNPNDPAFRELYLRWFAYGTFCPVMRLHGDRQPSPQKVYKQDGTQALFTGSDNEVWSYGEQAYEIAKKYMALREAMRPYTRALMQEAHEQGSPIMRPMFYSFPQQEACWDIVDQYMFGPDLLVAPVTEAGAKSRDIYLPRGHFWVELHTGKRHEGGQTVTVDTPLSVIPVFLRDGKQAQLMDAADF